MRTCQIRINNDGSVNISDAIDYVGEHCATELSITLNSELSSNSVSYYTLCFRPGAALRNPPQCKLTSDMIAHSELAGNVLKYKLPAVLTCFGSLDCQVVAHCISDKNEVTEIIKSPVFRILFEPSISGEDELFIEEALGFTALIHTALAQLNLTIEEADELCDKINEAFENGELNGPVIMPHVSEDGTLSWSNDAGLENPAPVNIKGPKGDKGDKGEDGKFSDELADEISENTAARHTHANKELLDSLTESMIGTLDVYHELPETANDGEICIYSPANVPTVADSGKLIYVDWDIFNKTLTDDEFTQFAITFFDANGEEVGIIYATSIDNGNGSYTTVFQYTKGDERWDVQFVGGVFDAESSAYTNGETITYLAEVPTSFTLPCFSSLVSDHYNISGDVFYAPIKLMVYRDGWYEYTSAATVDVSIGRSHELPQNAKEGDLFLYAPQNTLTLADSGKRIYFDWEELRKPVDEKTQYFSQLISANGETNVAVNVTRGNTLVDCFIEDYSSGIIFQVVFNKGILEFAQYGEVTYNSIEEIPSYYQLPQFDTFESNNLEGNAYIFHTEYRLMKYQGEWIEAVDAPTKTSQLVNDSGFITNDKIELTAEAATIQPNTYYSFGEAAALTLEFADGDDAKHNEYSFTFISGATPTVLTLPSSVKWVNELTVEANKRYEISIVDNIGLWCAVDVEAVSE